jgi:hypothetical protein
VELSEVEIIARLARWAPPGPRYGSGVLTKHAALVSSASVGAITRPALTVRWREPVATSRTTAASCVRRSTRPAAA